MVNIQEVVMIILIVNTTMTGFTALEPGGEVFRALNSACSSVEESSSGQAQEQHIFREQLSCLICGVCWT